MLASPITSIAYRHPGSSHKVSTLQKLPTSHAGHSSNHHYLSDAPIVTSPQSARQDDFASSSASSGVFTLADQQGSSFGEDLSYGAVGLTDMASSHHTDEPDQLFDEFCSAPPSAGTVSPLVGNYHASGPHQINASVPHPQSWQFMSPSSRQTSGTIQNWNQISIPPHTNFSQGQMSPHHVESMQVSPHHVESMHSFNRSDILDSPSSGVAKDEQRKKPTLGLDLGYSQNQMMANIDPSDPSFLATSGVPLHLRHNTFDSLHSVESSGVRTAPPSATSATFPSPVFPSSPLSMSSSQASNAGWTPFHPSNYSASPYLGPAQNADFHRQNSISSSTGTSAQSPTSSSIYYGMPVPVPSHGLRAETNMPRFMGRISDPSSSSISSGLSQSPSSSSSSFSAWPPIKTDATQKRASAACNFCRMRKLRCDGNAPCRQCDRRNLECVFSEAASTRRKRRAASATASNGVTGQRFLNTKSGGNVNKGQQHISTFGPAAFAAAMAASSAASNSPKGIALHPANVSHTPSFHHHLHSIRSHGSPFSSKSAAGSSNSATPGELNDARSSVSGGEKDVQSQASWQTSKSK